MFDYNKVMNCVSPPAGSVSPRSVPSRPLLQPQLSGADPRGLPGVFPLQSEEPDHQDPAGEQVSLPELSLVPPGPFHWMSESSDDESAQTVIS